MNRSTPRLHAGAWWCWGAGIAASALQTTNLLFLAMLASVVLTVASLCAEEGSSAHALTAFAKLGVFLILFRLVLAMVFGSIEGGTELVRIPSASLPSWASGIRVGGPVTLEGLVGAFAQGSKLAVAILAFGAVNSLCSPYRILRVVPAALYELGVASTVALTTAPFAVATARQLRSARRLRGRPTRGLVALRYTAVPVLEQSLDRSIQLAASMDVRGFGRAAAVPQKDRRRANLALAIGLACSALALYGLLAPTPSRWIGAVTGAVAVGALSFSLRALSRASTRTRYRPDSWDRWSILVCLASLTGAVAVGVAASRWPLAIDPPQRPLHFPSLPPLLIFAAIAASAPGIQRLTEAP